MQAPVAVRCFTNCYTLPLPLISSSVDRQKRNSLVEPATRSSLQESCSGDNDDDDDDDDDEMFPYGLR